MAAGLLATADVERRALRRHLRACLRPGGAVDATAFDAFRHRLLRHVTLEERVFAPALAAALGAPPPGREALRAEHAALAALCLPPPCRQWVEDLAELLEHHHRQEHAPGGFFALAHGALRDEAALARAAARLRPLVLPPFEAGPRVRELLRRVLWETGVSTDYPLTVLPSPPG